MNVFRASGACILLFSLTLSLAGTAEVPDSSSLPNPYSLLSAANLDAALRELDSRIQKDQKNALAHNVICRLYFQLENWDEAIAACEKAVDLNPQSSEFHQWLGRSYGEKAASAGPLKAFALVRKVKAEFERAVTLGKDNLAAHADLAEFYAEAPSIMGGDKAKARKLTEVVMQRDPADAHVMLGRLEEKMGAKNKAEAEFKAAIESGGSLARYWVDLAAFYRRTGHLSEMESAINTSLGARLDTGIALFDAGSLLLQSGRNFPAAIQIFRQYLSLDKFAEDGPAFQAHYRLGMSFEKQKDAQNAAREYRAALALASQYHPAQDALARVSR